MKKPSQNHPWRKSMVDVKKERKLYNVRNAVATFYKRHPSYQKVKNGKYIRNGRPAKK